MRSLVQILFVLTFFNGAFAQANELTCSEIKSSIIGYLFHYTRSAKNQSDVNVQFYISTQKVRRPMLIDTGEWNALKLSKFNPNKKTYLIIHGYLSNVHKNWVEDLKNSLLDYSDTNARANVIIVDWSNCTGCWNYVNTALNTQRASRQIFEFLEAMRSYVNSPLFEPDDFSRCKSRRLRALKKAKRLKSVRWNRLYFIGHSLGAHVSGQTAHLLKQNPFWKVERITGLDPAQPCFTNVDPSFKIDKSHANFVDIIHTQGGKKDNNDGFGLNALVGHLDFYVNGGLLQPECEEDSYFSINSKICSHKLASKYFIESIDNELIGACPFDSAPWDGSYVKAEELLAIKRNYKMLCKDCPKMGITAEYSNRTGRYIVFTSATAPFCQFKSNDFQKVKEVLKEIS